MASAFKDGTERIVLAYCVACTAGSISFSWYLGVMKLADLVPNTRLYSTDVIFSRLGEVGIHFAFYWIYFVPFAFMISWPVFAVFRFLLWAFRQSHWISFSAFGALSALIIDSFLRWAFWSDGPVDPTFMEMIVMTAREFPFIFVSGFVAGLAYWLTERRIDERQRLLNTEAVKGGVT